MSAVGNEASTLGEDQWPGSDAPLSFLWLEITGACNLRCVHCYADSGPERDHGPMTRAHWERVVRDAHALGAQLVQFIGGEPTLHPDFPDLVRLARDLGMAVEVYTNLVHVRQSTWQLFADCDVSLATSFYSMDEVQHDRVTARPSQRKTLSNIREAVSRGFPLRVGIVEVDPDQRVSETVSFLRSNGVNDIRVDRMRGVGRGETSKREDVGELCGKCASTNAAVDPDGWVYPCVFSRWLPVGNVKDAGLGEILGSASMRTTKSWLADRFRERAIVQDSSPSHGKAICPPYSPCSPNVPPCHPDCTPSCHPTCMPSCSPQCMPSCSPQCSPSCSPNCSPNCHPMCMPGCSPSRP